MAKKLFVKKDTDKIETKKSFRSDKPTGVEHRRNLAHRGWLNEDLDMHGHIMTELQSTREYKTGDFGTVVVGSIESNIGFTDCSTNVRLDVCWTDVSATASKAQKIKEIKKQRKEALEKLERIINPLLELQEETELEFERLLDSVNDGVVYDTLGNVVKDIDTSE